jgi:ubiquinone/menaquinone biosynthesis C-methylase UbiE
MERQEVLERCRVRGSSMLDIGAGPLARMAADNYDCAVVSIDVDREALTNKSREDAGRSEGGIHLFVADASRLPFRDDSFDVVVSYGALHHAPIEIRKEFLEECVRVSKDRICIVEYRRSTFVHRDEHAVVDEEWLLNSLIENGGVVKHQGVEMDLYLCIKDWH